MRVLMRRATSCCSRSRTAAPGTQEDRGGRGLLRGRPACGGARRRTVLQAEIALEHCRAPARGDGLGRDRGTLRRAARGAPDPVVALNRAVAVAMATSPEAGLALLHEPSLAFALTVITFPRDARRPAPSRRAGRRCAPVVRARARARAPKAPSAHLPGADASANAGAVGDNPRRCRAAVRAFRRLSSRFELVPAVTGQAASPAPARCST